MKQIIAVVLLSAAAIATLAPGSTLAQSAPTSATAIDSVGETRSIGLDDAIQMALKANYTIQMASNDVRRSELDEQKAKDFLLPQANLSAGYNFNKGLTHTLFDGVDLGFPAASHGFNYNASASINIFNGGADAARIRSTGYTLESFQSNFQWTKQQIVFNVTSAYLNALRNNELVTSAIKTLGEAQAQLTQIRGQYEAGVVPVAQVYQQEAVVSQDELSLIQAQNNYENSKADLLFLLNIAPTEYSTYGVNVNGLDTSTSPARRAEVRKTVTNDQIQHVIDTRPDIISLRQSIQSAQEAIDITRAAVLPRLDADVSVGGSGNDPTIKDVRFFNALGAGLSFSWEIFDRFQTRLSIDEQLVNIENSQIQLNQQEQSLRSDVAKAVNNLRFAEEALDASDREVRSAEEGLRLAEERLRVGAGTQIDVIVAQSQVETARTNRINAVFNYVLAQKQIQYTLGQWSY